MTLGATGVALGGKDPHCYQQQQTSSEHDSSENGDSPGSAISGGIETPARVILEDYQMCPIDENSISSSTLTSTPIYINSDKYDQLQSNANNYPSRIIRRNSSNVNSGRAAQPYRIPVLQSTVSLDARGSAGSPFLTLTENPLQISGSSYSKQPQAGSLELSTFKPYNENTTNGFQFPSSKSPTPSDQTLFPPSSPTFVQQGRPRWYNTLVGFPRLDNNQGDFNSQVSVAYSDNTEHVRHGTLGRQMNSKIPNSLNIVKRIPVAGAPAYSFNNINDSLLQSPMKTNIAPLNRSVHFNFENGSPKSPHNYTETSNARITEGSGTLTRVPTKCVWFFKRYNSSFSKKWVASNNKFFQRFNYFKYGI